MILRIEMLGVVVSWTRIAVGVLAVASLASLLPAANAPGPKDKSAAPKKSAPPPPQSEWAEWNSVMRFRGQFEGSFHVNRFRQTSSEVTKSDTLQTVAGSFVVEFNQGSKRWDVVSGEAAGSDRYVLRKASRDHHERSTSEADFSGPSAKFSVGISPFHGTWNFQLYSPLMPYSSTDSYDARDFEWIRNVGRWRETHERKIYPSGGFRGAYIRDNLPPGKPVPLTAVSDKPVGKDEYEQGRHVIRVHLVPEYKDLEVIVEIEGVTAEGTAVAYEKWIPRGTVSGIAGSSLKVKARLQTPDGASTRERVHRFVFKLNDTSREPGVCLNFPHPPQADPSFTAPDLRFGLGSAKDADCQEVELEPQFEQSGHAWAETRIECFDYGAWSNLSVTARLADGRTVTGHLKGNPSAILMTLPKRTGGSLIADAWKQEHNVTGGDLDDNEKLPNAGKVPGDGFTLYEEYRGFVEDGKHLEGDPEKIDFFIRNFIGRDAEPGMFLFEQLTGAKLHTKLKDGEFVFEKRVMNVNHDRGPHLVDQYGVFLETQPGIDGAEARFTVKGVRGRPHLCTGILVQPRGANTPVTNHENLAPSEAIFAYDRTIAHELLHTVGVEHHGKGDGRASITFVFADDPRNKTGRPMFWIGDPAKRVVAKVDDEVSGRDMAEVWAQKLNPARAAVRPSEYPKLLAKQRDLRSQSAGKAAPFTVEQEAEMELNGMFGIWTGGWSVGAEHGESSGDDNCIMRYYFAQIYEKKGVKNAFYFITNPHTEKAGLGLCRSPVGTGVNDSERSPQPRYGDARAAWGPCADWIVFNDAIPTHPNPN